MSERFGPNFAPGSFALQQSIRLVYTLRALSRGRNRSTRATRDNQDAHTQIDHTHARQRRDNTTASPRLRRGAGRCCYRAAATAAAAAAAAAAAVLLLLHDPRCITEHNPSQQTVSRFVFFGTHAGASKCTAAAAAAAAAEATAAAVVPAAAQQQQHVQQQGRSKHMYEYTTIRHQAG